MQGRSPAFRETVRGRYLRGDATRRLLQPVLWVGPHSPTVRQLAPGVQVCAKGRVTNDHRCLVEGRKAGEGRPCPRGTTKCANCGAPHGSRADARTAKRSALQLSRGWKTPPPSHRERKVPGSEITASQGEGGSGEAEVGAREGGSAQAGEGMELGK